jgi:hypothetical protein
MFRLPLRLFGPALVGTALLLLAAIPSFAATAASPVTIGNGLTTISHPGSIPIRSNAVFHLRGHATCPSGHFLYVNEGNTTNAIQGFVINADCSLTPTPGSPYLTGGQEWIGYWASNQIATSVANGPCVYATDSGGNGTQGFVDSFSVASTGALTKVSQVAIADGSSNYAVDVRVSADGKYVYATAVGSSTTLDALTVGSGCTLTLSNSVNSPSGAVYESIALLDGKGIEAVNVYGTIDIYSITNGTTLKLVSSTHSQVSTPAGAAFAPRTPIGPVTFNGNIGTAQLEAHTINGQGVLGSVPGSPASDSGATTSANLFFDASLAQVTATEQFNGSQFANSMGIFGAKAGQLALLSHVSLPGSDFPTAQAELGSELYITNELGSSVEACAMAHGSATCSLATTFSGGEITQGIGVL